MKSTRPKSFQRRAIVPILLTSSALAHGAAAPEQEDLAERLLQTGLALTESRESMPVAAAIADAAERMFDADRRLLRTAADLRLRLGNRDRAIELLGQFRKLEPGDQLAQVQTIDLLVDRMETADQKAAYLRQVIGSPSVPAEVKSHAAVQLARVESERARDDDALAAIDEALKFSPVNPAALQVKVSRAMTSTTPAPQRAAALVNLLQANPMSFAALGTLANELSRVGANEQALALYKQLFTNTEGSPTPPAPQDAIDYAALLLSMGQPKSAVLPAQLAVQLDPGSAEAHFMRLLVGQQLGDAKAVEVALGEARTALTRNVMYLHRYVDPKAPAIDDNTPVALPDLTADVAAIKAGGDARLAREYEAALGDLAWLDAYFAAKAPDAALAEALGALGDEKSLTLARATAFAALAAQQTDDAHAKLSAIADRDLLSRAALLAARIKKGEAAAGLVPDATKAIEQLPTGVWSATLRSTLRDLGPLTIRTADADAVIAEAAKLPAEWLAFAKNGRAFYVVDIDVIKAQVDVGEPIVMSVTMQNIGNRPLVIGPGGPIDQQVILDATVRGTVEQGFPGAASARMTGALVLQPRQRIVTQVRVDNPQMFGFMSGNPQVSMAVFVSGIANPMLTQAGILPGPGGFRSQSRSVIDRKVASFQRPDSRQRLTEQLNSPDATPRLHAVQAIAGNGLLLAQQPAEELKQIATQAQALVKKAAESDASSTVRAIASQLVVAAQPETGRDAAIRTMLISPDAEARLLGALLVMGRPLAERQKLLEPLANDSDDVLKRLAVAIIALPEPAPAATQPADAQQ